MLKLYIQQTHKTSFMLAAPKLFWPILVVLFMVLNGCNSKQDTSISFPSSGLHGNNLLAIADSTQLTEDAYSLAATLGKDANLIIVITNFSTNTSAVWFYTSLNGWSASSYAGNQQQFISISDERLDAKIRFPYGPGACQVDFYENSSTITQSKYFSW